MFCSLIVDTYGCFLFANSKISEYWWFEVVSHHGNFVSIIVNCYFLELQNLQNSVCWIEYGCCLESKHRQSSVWMIEFFCLWNWKASIIGQGIGVLRPEIMVNSEVSTV